MFSTRSPNVVWSIEPETVTICPLSQSIIWSIVGLSFTWHMTFPLNVLFPKVAMYRSERIKFSLIEFTGNLAWNGFPL